MRRRTFYNVTVLLGLMTAFVVAASAFGASKLQASQGGSWWHAFLSGLRPLAFLTAPVTVVLVFGTRSHGDRMPGNLWADHGTKALSGRTFRLSTTDRVMMSSIFAVCLLGAPFFAHGAARDGPGATLFVAVWLATMVPMMRHWLRSSPEALTLTPDDVLHVEGPLWGRHQWDIPVASFQAIKWPTMGQYVEMRYSGRRMWVPKQVEDLDRLVVELRRRNPNIQFDGRWPPRGFGFT